MLLIQTPIRKTHNELIKPPLEVDFEVARLESGEVIIGDTSLRKYMPHKVKKISNHQKVMCGCEMCISASMMQYELKPDNEIPHSRIYGK